MSAKKNQFIGGFDAVRHGCAYGWVCDQSDPTKSITIQAKFGKVVLAEGQTHLHRPDLKGLPAGFAIPLPDHAFKIEACQIHIVIKETGQNLLGGPKKLRPEYRLSHCIDGFVERNIISGWLKDHLTPDATKKLTVQLLENDEVITTSICDGLIDESGQIGRFSLTLPLGLLDATKHEFTFRCVELDWEFECREFQTPSADPSRDYTPPPFLNDTAWETSLTGKLAYKKWLTLKTKRSQNEQKLDALEKQLLKAKSSDIKRRYDLICEIAYLLKANNKPDEAIERFQAAISIDPIEPQAYAAIADLLMAKAQESEAEAWLRKALRKLPETPEFLNRIDTILALRRPKTPPKVIAFYLPQFHPTPENDQWWGKGFTEWTNVTAATPMFYGHLQPRHPTALSYYDLRLPEAANAQFDLARRYGIDAFCYYYYWFDGKKVLDRPLQDLVDGKTGPFPFCICWANEDWTRSWDGMSGEVLLAQNHSTESDFRFIKDIAPLLKHPNYERHKGKPVILIYRADKLASPKKTVKAWRQWCRNEGIGELHLCAVQSFGFDDPRPFGFDAAVEFPPHCVREKYPNTVFHKTLDNLPGIVENFRGAVYDYPTFADAFINRPREPYSLHQGCFLAWDNTARRGKTAHVFQNFSVSKYQAWLTSNLAKASRQPDGGIVFINAWNEWAEGTVLEPDHHFGYSLLEATRTAKDLARLEVPFAFWKHVHPILHSNRLDSGERIILVGHDAHPHGAQINLLQMARSLKRDLQIEVVILLLQGGGLVAEYERVGTTIVLGQAEGWLDSLVGIARHYFAMGTRKAICNTVVTGIATQILQGNGYKVVSLVHELPSLIELHSLQSACWHVAAHADSIVFASEVVSREFCHRYWPESERVLIAPQGIAFNPYQAKREALRKELRNELDLPANIRIIMGCGYGDTRKGIDLFVQMAGELARQVEDIAFIWVGGLEDQLKHYLQADIGRLGLQDRLHITGRVDDTAFYFIASDLFALTSREDPFPSVVMEAFDAGLPVVAFSGGGGYVDLINEKTGILVPYLDVSAMAKAFAELLFDDLRRNRISEHAHQYSRATFGYPAYLHKLLALLNGVPARAVTKGILNRQAWYEDSPIPRISAIVPNYNYGRYLELRLRSILNQTLSPAEIIVLDDASTDYSRDLILNIAAESNMPIRLLSNDRNTGNPFVQWAKGIAEASGDLIWIAEADDYCEPTLLETLARELADENVMLAWCDSCVVDHIGQSQGFEYKSHFGEKFGQYWHRNFKMHGRDLIEQSLSASNVIPNASAVLFRRQAVDADLSFIQQFSFSGDWWFWISMAEKGMVSYCAKALNYHRRHSQSVVGNVLREGERLIPETLAFYHRLAEHKKTTFTSKTILGIFNGLEDMYRLFPKLQADAYWLREHPSFQNDYLKLEKLLAPLSALKSTQAITPALLVMSGDALYDYDIALRLVRHFEDQHDLSILLLCEEEKAADFIESAKIDKGKVSVVPPGLKGRVKASNNKVHSLPALASIGREDLNKAFGSAKELVSHGLLAHCVVVDHFKSPEQSWQLVAGKEFDVLLGQVPAMMGVTLKKLEKAIKVCSLVRVVKGREIHVINRICLESKKQFLSI